MRFKSLGLMATFWVLSGVNGEDGGRSSLQTETTFTTKVDNFVLNTTGAANYSLSITTKDAHLSSSILFLCQATPEGQNINIAASRIGAYCIGPAIECETSKLNGNIQNDIQMPLAFNLTQGNSAGFFFLCFTNKEGLCASASNALQFPGSNTVLSGQENPQALVLSQEFKPANATGFSDIRVVGAPGATLPGPTITSMITTIAPPTSSPTADTSSTDIATPAPASSGLSTGAKAGIAVGALGVAIIILLGALLCLRRRHRRTSAPDQIMLNQSSADSRDLITEKETERNSPQSYEAPTPVYGANLNVSPKSQTRHSALSPYEEIPSQPYTGSAAAIPRRKPTLSPKSTSASSSTNQATTAALAAATTGAVASSSTTVPSISREVSAASTIGPPSRGTPPITNESSPPTNRDFEQYRDVPTTYADRHTPQVFEGGLQAPFLGSESNISRESMSEADLARLTEEEEERRIDAAIEEAERKRRP